MPRFWLYVRQKAATTTMANRLPESWHRFEPPSLILKRASRAARWTKKEKLDYKESSKGRVHLFVNRFDHMADVSYDLRFAHLRICDTGSFTRVAT